MIHPCVIKVLSIACSGEGKWRTSQKAFAEYTISDKGEVGRLVGVHIVKII